MIYITKFILKVFRLKDSWQALNLQDKQQDNKFLKTHVFICTLLLLLEFAFNRFWLPICTSRINRFLFIEKFGFIFKDYNFQFLKSLFISYLATLTGSDNICWSKKWTEENLTTFSWTLLILHSLIDMMQTFQYCRNHVYAILNQSAGIHSGYLKEFTKKLPKSFDA